MKYSSREAALNAIKTLNGAQTVLVSFVSSKVGVGLLPYLLDHSEAGEVEVVCLFEG